MKAFFVKDSSGEFLIETKKRSPIGKTLLTSGFQRLRSPRVTEEAPDSSEKQKQKYLLIDSLNRGI